MEQSTSFAAAFNVLGPVVLVSVKACTSILLVVDGVLVMQ